MDPDRVRTVRETLMDLKSRYPLSPPYTRGENEDMALLIRIVMMIADEVTK